MLNHLYIIVPDYQTMNKIALCILFKISTDILPLDELLFEWQLDTIFVQYFVKFFYICYSVAPLCLTLCDSMDCSTPGFPVLHYLLELAQMHVHWVGDAIQPSHPLLFPFSWLQSSPASGSFLMTQPFESGGQVLEFQLQDQSFQWIFRINYF